MNLARADWTLHPHVEWTKLGRVEHSVVHHTADEFVTKHNPTDSADAYRADLIGYMRRVEAAEMGRGDDLIAIAYHWVIDQFGTLVEARPIDAQGGATLGYNSGPKATRAYCLVGNFQNHPPSDAQLATLVGRLRADIAARWLTGPVQPTWGHRDVVATACPGNDLYPLLPHVRDLVRAGGPISPFPAPEEFDVLKSDITGHLITEHGEWLLQADGGIQTIAGPFCGSYPGLPPDPKNPNRRFYGPLEPRTDGKAGYVMWSNDAFVDPKTGKVGGRYSFP